MLRKTIWQFLGAVLALGAIFATYDVFTRSKPLKELQVILNSATPLVSEKPLIPGSVQVTNNIQLTYNHGVVSNAFIYQVTVKNTGNQPIVESDYSKPLVFSFMTKDDILEAAVTVSNPPNIGMVIHKTSVYQAAVDPVLLNPGDTVLIKFIVAITEDVPLIERMHIDGRIVGVKEIKLVTSTGPLRASLDLKNVAIFSLMGVLAGIFSSLAYERLLGVMKKPGGIKNWVVLHRPRN
jgi:hypothetical protein